MSGKDFARSVVCSVHTNRIEDYLTKVDAMPPQLADARVHLSVFSVILCIVLPSLAC